MRLVIRLFCLAQQYRRRELLSSPVLATEATQLVCKVVHYSFLCVVELRQLLWLLVLEQSLYQWLEFGVVHDVTAVVLQQTGHGALLLLLVGLGVDLSLEHQIVVSGRLHLGRLDSHWGPDQC